MTILWGFLARFAYPLAIAAVLVVWSAFVWFQARSICMDEVALAQMERDIRAHRADAERRIEAAKRETERQRILQQLDQECMLSDDVRRKLEAMP